MFSCKMKAFFCWLPLVLVFADDFHRTPPMGWSSWNTFFSEIDEEKVLGIADSIKRLKLDEFGYVYLTIDDFWNLPERDAVTGQMLVNTTRYPHGMKYLGEYLHQKGLKFGLYSDAGVKTCGGMAGSLGHEALDLNQFLDWDIDYLKYDNCYPSLEHIHDINIGSSLAHLPSFYQRPAEKERFSAMGQAIKEAQERKNITMELCLYGWGNVEEWGFQFAQLWRTSGDIRDEWDSLLVNLDRNDELRFHTLQGFMLPFRKIDYLKSPQWGWNYPDALFVGKGGMTLTEYQTMFTLWCIIKSPLMLGNDLRNMEETDEAYKIITNEKLLSINQDSLGIQAKCVKNCCSHGPLGGIDTSQTCKGFKNSWQLWSGPLASQNHVLVVLNRYDHALTNVTFNLYADAKIPLGSYLVSDLWTEGIEMEMEGQSDLTIPFIQAHAVLALRFEYIIQI